MGHEPAIGVPATDRELFRVDDARSGVKSHARSICVAMASMFLSVSVHAQTASLIDLGANVSAYGINASGEVTGCIPAAAGTTHAFIYAAGVATDLGTLGGSSSCGYALNANGQVTGYADTAGGTTHAFLYSGGTMSDLGTVAGAYETVGTAINASGAIVGYAVANPGVTPRPSVDTFVLAQFLQNGSQAFTFLDVNGIMTELLSRPVDQGSVVGDAINDGGTIAGLDLYAQCNFLCPYGSAFLYLNGSQTDLADSALFFTTATAINNVGQVVGYGEDGYAHNHGVIYANGGVTDLGNDTEAYAINSSGQVVGLSNVGLYYAVGPAADAFIYSNGKIVSLNTPGAVPSGINDSGWIIANNPTLNHAYLLRPSNVSLDPTGMSFGNGVIGAASSGQPACGACAVTLTNGTGAAISVGTPTISGPFSQSTNNCPSSLAAGASCAITLNFTPTAPDTNLGAASITAGGTTYATLLSGIGTILTTLKSSLTTVGIGSSFTLTWSATPGASCEATGGARAPNNAPLDSWTGTKPASGSSTLTESAANTLDFTLTCTDGSQSAKAQAPVTVAAPKVSLTANSSSQVTGQAAVLTWTSNYATSCSASGGGSGDGWAGTKATKGTASVGESSAGTFVYTMTCTSGASSVKSSAQIVFNAPKSGGGTMDEISLAFLLVVLSLAQIHRARTGQNPSR